MKKLLLSQGKIALIDDKDFARVGGYKWTYIADTKSGHAYRKVNGNTVYLHRYILNAKSGDEIDHLNRNGLDNRRKNLRFVTHQENMVNRSKQVNNKSGVPGVYWYKKLGKWRAQVQRFGKNIHLGYFDSLEEAQKARFIVQ